MSKRNENKISLASRIDCFLFKWIINWVYPQYFRPKYGYIKYYKLFLQYVIPQKIFRINGNVPWPVHYTSKIINADKISKGIICDPGDSIGIYIQANNGIEFGNNVELSPGVVIVSSNHEKDDFSKHDFHRPIKIGDNVIIYANSVVLPGVHIGDNVLIGAGSIVTKDIPSNSIAVGNPCKVIKDKPAYNKDFKNIKLNR